MKIGFVRFFPIFTVLYVGWSVAPAAGKNPVPAADGPIPVSVRDNPDFVDITVQLQAMVNALGFHKVNHFCVVGYGMNSDDIIAPFIYWPTQNKIATWEAGRDQPILNFSEYFDLERDDIKLNRERFILMSESASKTNHPGLLGAW